MPNAFANEVGIFQFYNNLENDDGTFTFTTHQPYFELESGEFVPYRLTENDSMVQIEFYEGKFVFDKIEGAVTSFDSDGNVVIASDSYVVREAEIGSDIWNNLEVNNSPVITTVTTEADDTSGDYSVAWPVGVKSDLFSRLDKTKRNRH